MRPDPEKVQLLKNAEPPEKKSELRSFLGMAGYGSPFIPKFSEKTSKLRDVLTAMEYEWKQEQQMA